MQKLVISPAWLRRNSLLASDLSKQPPQVRSAHHWIAPLPAVICNIYCRCAHYQEGDNPQMSSEEEEGEGGVSEGVIAKQLNNWHEGVSWANIWLYCLVFCFLFFFLESWITSEGKMSGEIDWLSPSSIMAAAESLLYPVCSCLFFGLLVDLLLGWLGLHHSTSRKRNSLVYVFFSCLSSTSD